MEPSGGVGKAAAELIKEMQQAQQELEQAVGHGQWVEGGGRSLRGGEAPADHGASRRGPHLLPLGPSRGDDAEPRLHALLLPA